MRVGLRIDVDTLRGTLRGVPRLLTLLAERDIRASFFFSVGPDNMGRHLWRLFRPSFLWKMLRTGAPSLYGWDIVLRGTLWPGPRIGAAAGDVLRAAAEAGHEIGLHAWDHHDWQAHLEAKSRNEIEAVMRKGIDEITAIIGRPPSCSAAPGWRCTDDVLLAQAGFGFQYNSDCRGDRIFHPVVDGETLPQVQIPVTLPTYDEVVGRDVKAEDFNSHLLGLLSEDRLNVLTIHAEVEGISCADMFDRFLTEAEARGARFVPLGELADIAEIGTGSVVAGELPGREGQVACLAG